MYKFSLIFLSTFVSYTCFAQSEGTKRSYEIQGLPKGDTVFDSLKIGVPLIILGIIIAYLGDGRKKDAKSTSNDYSWIGILIVFVGFFFLFPVLTWLEYILVNLISLGILIFFVIVILVLIFSKK